MKRFLWGLCLSVLFVGCVDDSDYTNQKTLFKYVNKWVYDNMDQLYYWNTTLPASRSTSENPSDYFKTLKNKDDRFSAIFDSYEEISNELNGINSAEIGFYFQLYYESPNNDNVVGVVLYTKKGTPAEKMGIIRGDLFRKINGMQITSSNYSTLINSLFDNTASVNITFSTHENETYTDKAAVTVIKAVNYKEDPVFMDTVYTVQNKKIGYLVYNFFTNDAGDKSMKYDLELNNVIGQFKQQNISELIIDLRYNRGGAMTSAVHLASMLVPNLTTNKVFAYTEFNKNYTDYFNSSAYKSKYSDNPFVTFFSTNINVTASYPIQNVGNNLQRIFFLTGHNTASASEMVINGLKPFLPCVLIGDTTVGKNVGSTLVYDKDNTSNQWAFMPIILKYFNKDHQSDFTQGFIPDYLVSDDYKHPMGDTGEGLLNKAIRQISGLSASPSKSAPVNHVLLKSSFDFKPIHAGLVVKTQWIDSYLNHNNK